MAYRRTDQVIARLGENRRAILTAAHSLVAEGGFAAVQMTEIARRADIATGTLYRYFPAKDDLCCQIYRELAARELKLLAATAAGDDSAASRLSRALALFASRAARGRPIAYALLLEPVEPALLEERAAFRGGQAAILADLLRQGMAESSLRQGEPDVLAAALAGAITGALVTPGVGAANLKPEQAIENVLRFCESALRDLS